MEGIKKYKIFAAPLLALIIMQLPIFGANYEAKAVLAITCWIAIWWISEEIPIAATSLIPLVFFPLFNIVSVQEVASKYANSIIFLFLGGFLLALSIEKWKLHKRIALLILVKVGTEPKKIILGFMLSAAFLSMWISNSAAALMILPIGLAVCKQFSDFNQEAKIPHFNKAMMLGTAYAASIGGTATLIGSPTNLIFSATAFELFNEEIDFLKWLIFALPISIVMIFLTYQYLTRISFKINGLPANKALSSTIKKQYADLGELSYEEKIVSIIFGLVAFLWIFKLFIFESFLPGVNDTSIALLGGILLFAIPASDKKTKIMDWETAKKLPWDILLLFGGGLAIANGFQVSRLAEIIGNGFSGLSALPLLLILFVLIATINFLTELTSNVATAAVLMPIMAGIAYKIGVHPYFLMLATSITASYAFMLPVATPPNAVVFGSGYLKIKEMVKIGFWLNIVSIIILTLAHYFILPYLWNLDI